MTIYKDAVKEQYSFLCIDSRNESVFQKKFDHRYIIENEDSNSDSDMWILKLFHCIFDNLFVFTIDKLRCFFICLFHWNIVETEHIAIETTPILIILSPTFISDVLPWFSVKLKHYFSFRAYLMCVSLQIWKILMSS